MPHSVITTYFSTLCYKKKHSILAIYDQRKSIDILFYQGMSIGPLAVQVMLLFIALLHTFRSIDIPLKYSLLYMC